MKKIFTLLTACTLTLAANSQVYFSDDFEGGSLTGNEAWTVQTISNPDAIDAWVYGTVSGNYAKCSNHTGGAGGVDHVLNSWLISPSMNLSAGTAVDLTFDNVTRYGTLDMVVHISTDYDGTSDPTSQGTWTDITSLFTLDTDDFDWTLVSAGTADISAYISANTYIAFEFIGSATDGPTWEVDNVSVVENGTVVTPTTTSIYDIQYTTDPSGDSPEKDNVVTTRGVVTGIYQIGSNADRFFIQDGDGAWNGIYVYENGTTVALGDSVFVTGTVQEFNGLTELGFVSDITIINSGNAQPTAAVVTSSTVGNEEYEGVLVKVEDGINTVAPDQYGAWIINDGGTVIIDDDLMASFAPVLGNAYDVTGVRHLSFGDILVLPRDAVNDIVTVGYASVEENELEVSIYPNPATTNVTISGIENGTVTIYAVSGEVVYGSKVNGTVTINTEDLNAGIYMIEVIENNVKANYKFIVK